MAVLLCLQFDDESEAIQFRDSIPTASKLRAVYKVPTLFCENKKECWPIRPNERHGTFGPARGWYICKTCHKFLKLKMHKDTDLSTTDYWFRRHQDLGWNILERFRRANVGDKL